jgi:hypothetical protein
MIEGHTLAFEGPDTFFRDCMTLADVYRYPGHHFDFDARQLTLTSGVN